VTQVATDFDADLPPVTCLPSDINRAVVNLVINAAHAVAEAVRLDPGRKREIIVRTRRDGDWAEIRVEDSGAGIPEEIRDRIFEPFFTTKDVGQGSGQGLALTRAVVVEKHGGTIHFETQMGCGATFVIRLPIGAPDAEGKVAG
jgi:signal transduction histidine kinase